MELFRALACPEKLQLFVRAADFIGRLPPFQPMLLQPRAHPPALQAAGGILTTPER
jgi:hypothetical protein